MLLLLRRRRVPKPSAIVRRMVMGQLRGGQSKSNRGDAARYPAQLLQHATAAAIGGTSRAQRVQYQLPTPADKFNYVRRQMIWSGKFFNYLTSNRFYEHQLHAKTQMINKKTGAYTINVCFEHMCKFCADVDLIRAIINNRFNLHPWLLPGAKNFLRKFLSDRDYAKEETINGTRLSFNHFPESVHTCRNFRKIAPLVKDVPLIGGKTSVLAPTFHGSRFMQILLVGISANHSNSISWGGEFSEENILIIEHKSMSNRVDTRDSTHYEMKIIQKPFKGKGRSLRAAMVNDLHRVAEILIPFYKVGDDLPAMFADLKEDLEGVEEAFVEERWFIEYLTNHPSFMPSSGRETFLIHLHRSLEYCNMLLDRIVVPKLTGHPSFWKTILESETRNKKLGCKSTITVLQNVYGYNKRPGISYRGLQCDQYQASLRDQIRFMRNVIEHGNKHDAGIKGTCELELYLIKMFDGFFPALVRILLKSGVMNNLQEAWSSYEVSNLIKLTGSFVKDTRNGQECLHPWLLRGAKKIVRKFISDRDYVKEETTINGTRLSFNDYPESVHMSRNFRKIAPLVQDVPLIGGKTSVLAPTFHGSRFMQILLVGISVNHSNGISWGGEFSEENIMIIEHKSMSNRVDTRDSAHYEMKIIQKPFKGKGRSLRAAMVNDLHRVAEILIPFYKVGDDLPAMFVDLKGELEGVEEAFVEERWFIQYLTNHPSFMPSSGRETFLIHLHRAPEACNMLLDRIVVPKLTGYPRSWKTIVESETSYNKLGEKSTITVLQNVYGYKKGAGISYAGLQCDQYHEKTSLHDQIRFMRNVIEHGNRHDAGINGTCELELYLIKMFNGFFPALVRILLKSGVINDLQEAWSSYEVSKFIKLTGSIVKDTRNGQQRLYYV